MKSSGHDGPRPPSVRSEKDGTPSTTDDVDLDPFLTVLETRLRNPYSSFDLVRALDQYNTPTHASPTKDSDSTGAGRSVGQADNVQLLGRLFSRMAKSVKLRAIVGLMGLEPQPAPKGEQKEELNEARSVLDNALWKVLSSTECTDVDAAEGSHSFGGASLAIEDEWVRVLSDVVRRVLFVASEIESAADDQPNGASTSSTSRTEAQAAPVVGLRRPCKGQAFSNIIQNATDKIVSEICTSASSSAGKVIRNGDPTVLFAPESLVLLPSIEVEKFVPEVVINPHFAVNMMSPAMKVDVESEFRRAEEENLKDTEDLERKQRVGTQSGQAALVSAKLGGLSGIPTARSGSGANAAGKDIPKNGGRLGRDTASLLVRSKKPGTLGRGRIPPVMTGNGRGMGARAMGRGSAAAAVGRSLGVPTKKVMPRPREW